jgi:hypothetical protein
MKKKHKRHLYPLTILLGLIILGWLGTPKKTNKEIILQKSLSALRNGEQPAITTIPDQVLLNVPFTSQSPFAQWQDPEQNSACEEASMVMSWHWIKNKPLDKDAADKEIKDLIAFENEKNGNAFDTSAADTLKTFTDYYGDSHISLKYDITQEDIISELAEGHLVFAPANGIELHNPNFRAPGPAEHMLVIRGYDNDKKEFITNDPGTRNGEGYRYSYDTLYNALRDYPTGHHEEISSTRKAILVVVK